MITAFCLDATRAGHSLRAVIIAAIFAHTLRNMGFAPNQRTMTSVRLGIGSKEQQHEKAAEPLSVTNHSEVFGLRAKKRCGGRLSSNFHIQYSSEFSDPRITTFRNLGICALRDVDDQTAISACKRSKT